MTQSLFVSLCARLHSLEELVGSVGEISLKDDYGKKIEKVCERNCHDRLKIEVWSPSSEPGISKQCWVDKHFMKALAPHLQNPFWDS